jgi:hypothetical protein
MTHTYGQIVETWLYKNKRKSRNEIEFQNQWGICFLQSVARDLFPSNRNTPPSDGKGLREQLKENVENCRCILPNFINDFIHSKFNSIILLLEGTDPTSIFF